MFTEYELATGLEHAKDLGEDLVLIGAEVDDAVRDNDVDRVVRNAGGIEVFARLQSHAFVDVTGYFLGDAVVPPPPLFIAPDPELVPPIPPAPPADDDFVFSLEL